MNDLNSPPLSTEAPPPIPNVRPTAITVICVLGLLGAVFTIPMLFTEVARQIGAWYPPYLGLSAVIGGICMIGFWQMRRWAVFTYTGFCAINQVILFATGNWNAFALVFPGIVIAILYSYLSRMR